MVGIMGIVVDVPLYTIIALIKSPYMLFKGSPMIIQNVISRERWWRLLTYKDLILQYFYIFNL